tara:strand:- start:545 stop:1015 length:471 start_codon:yes stop_codon:yes gene_type:complete
MRKYLLPIILVSISLGQDILITKMGTEYKGKMLEAGYYKVQFQAEGMKSAQSVGIETIKSLVLSDGTEVVRDGYLVKKDSITKADNFKKIKSLKLSNVGGILIGVSGILLYSNNQRTPKENSSLKETEDFIDKSKSNADLAYVLLTLGGALIAIDK